MKDGFEWQGGWVRKMNFRPVHLTRPVPGLSQARAVSLKKKPLEQAEAPVSKDFCLSGKHKRPTKLVAA